MAKKERPDPGEASADAGFDMTPMIDVTFLLIIFFMCVTEMADASKEKLVLPIAEEAITDKPIPGRLVVNINKSGEFKILGKSFSDKGLHTLLEIERQASMGEADEFPTRAVLVRVDAETPYGAVQHFMGLCMQHKLWRLAFSTCNPEFASNQARTDNK